MHAYARAYILTCMHPYMADGLRSYYLNRSQPPMLTQMVAAIVDSATKPPAAGAVASGATPAAGAAAVETVGSGDGSAVEGGSARGGRWAAPQQSGAADGGSAADGAAGWPPLPPHMLAWLESALPVLDAEYRWWMRDGENGSAVRLGAQGGGGGRPVVTLNRYVVQATHPRPESYREDVQTASSVEAKARPALYAELAAGAETGWDYSSRWLSASGAAGKNRSLATIRTSRIVAVELNAILFRNERQLHRLHLLRADAIERVHLLAAAGGGGALEGGGGGGASNRRAAAAYAEAATARQAAMDAWMWSDTTGRWHDVDLASGEPLAEESAASYTPLWAVGTAPLIPLPHLPAFRHRCLHRPARHILQGAYGAKQAEGAVAALNASRLLQAGGLATTLEHTGQQWDCAAQRRLK